ncbi:MAG: hypothetical protein K2H98_08050 [Duncaniella sp.]|nr:hypothetical protein [Duncaniella sp.]
MKKYAIIFIAVMGYAVSALTAEPERYYPVDEALATRIARDRTAGIVDDDTRMIRENAIAEAFSTLFRTAAVKPRDLEKIRSRMAIAAELLDSLRRIDRCTEAKSVMLETMTDSVAASADGAALNLAADSLVMRIENARAALEEATAKMRGDSTALAALRVEADSVMNAVERLRMLDSIATAEHETALYVKHINPNF